MVLSNAVRVVRNKSSLVNRTNVCGGPGKSGMAPTIGRNFNGRTIIREQSTLPTECDFKIYARQNQRRGYMATLGR